MVRDFPIAYHGACMQRPLLRRDLEHGTVAASGSTYVDHAGDLA